MAKIPVQFRLNGTDRAAFVDTPETLLNTLRRSLGDFAPKYGCGQGACGVCTVLIDGEPHLSCLTLSVACEGRQVETASGMADGPELHPLQAQFMEHFAAQCGFCTPGMLTAARALLDKNPNPTRDEFIVVIRRHPCRSPGYAPFVSATLAASGLPALRRA